VSASPAPLRYEIQAASKLTGIPIDTLRAWERRYGAVVPGREGRSRSYTDADIARLRLLHLAVTQGHRIGRIAPLDTPDLRRLVGSAQLETNSTAIVSALRRLDTAAVDRELVRLATVLQPLELVRDVFMPELARIGEDVRRKRVTFAHEHLLSAAVRNLLGSFMRLYVPREDAPVVVLATPAGERHELGTLGAAMIAASRGYRVTYLGPDLPPRVIVEAATAAHARVLVLGVTMGGDRRERERDVRAIARALPEAVELWLGGARAAGLSMAAGSRAIALHDFDSYLAHLQRLEAA
jgi:DNA-binding transcriptional MerR regulator/methylmalonyl-CoA mutase cobalamin-binding subunit